MTIYEYGQHLVSYSETTDIEELKRELEPLAARTALVIEKYPLVSSSGKVHYRFGVVADSGTRIIPLKYGTKADSLCRKIFGLEASSAPKSEKELQARLRLLQGIVAEQEVKALKFQRKLEAIRELPSFREKSLADLEAEKAKKEAEIAETQLEILELEQRKQQFAHAKEKTTFAELITETEKEIANEKLRLKDNPEYQRLEALELLRNETKTSDPKFSTFLQEISEVKKLPSLKNLRKLEKTLSEVSGWKDLESPSFKQAVRHTERCLELKREQVRLKESFVATINEVIARKRVREGGAQGGSHFVPFSPKAASLQEQIAEYEQHIEFYDVTFAALGSKSAEILNTMYETAKTRLSQLEEKKAAITAEIAENRSEITRLAEKTASTTGADLIKLTRERSYQVYLRDSNESILKKLEKYIEEQKDIIARHEKRRTGSEFTPRDRVQKDTLRLALPLQTVLNFPSVTEEKDLESAESPGIIGTFLAGVALSAFNLLISISENWPVKEKHR